MPHTAEWMNEWMNKSLSKLHYPSNLKGKTLHAIKSELLAAETLIYMARRNEWKHNRKKAIPCVKLCDRFCLS